MSAFDGLTVLEGLLDLPRLEACKPGTPQARPGPCPSGRLRPSRLRRRTLIKRSAVRHAPPRAAAYTGPRFPMSNDTRATWDQSVADALKAADFADKDDAAKDTARKAAAAFRASLSAAELRRFEQETKIAQGHEEWRRATAESERDTLEQMRANMRDALREQWSGKKIAIRVTPQTLERVVREGRFRTVHETGSTSGFNNPKNRKDLEQQLFGIEPFGADRSERPVYGYVAVNGIRPHGKDAALGAYGPVQVVLKDAVRARTTASNGDSMSKRNAVRPSPVDAPEHWSYWAQQQQPGQYQVDGEKLASRDYAEAQIHGGVTVDDIEEVVYAREPDETVQRKLTERGIPWRVVQD